MVVLSILVIFVSLGIALSATQSEAQTDAKMTEIVDGFNRTVTVPVLPQKVICSNAGCLRYLVYLQGQEKVVGVDTMETNVRNPHDPRGYALANPQFKDLPVFGGYPGKDDPEKIIDIAPDLIFKSSFSNSPAAYGKESLDELQRKTNIPVIGFIYGGLLTQNERKEMASALILMGKVMGKEERAQQLIDYINSTISDLEKRTKDIPEASLKTAYIGGVQTMDAYGFLNTEPLYLPFQLVNVKNIGADFWNKNPTGVKGIISKEYLIAIDPEYIFIDLSTIQGIGGSSAIDQLKNDTVFRQLSAVRKGNVYGILPYTWYATNYENGLADAYFVGKILYPEKFADIDPVQKADEITAFFDGMPLMGKYQENFNGLVFKQIPL